VGGGERWEEERRGEEERRRGGEKERRRGEKERRREGEKERGERGGKEGRELYLVICLAARAIAYSATTVFPAEVWAATNTLSPFSKWYIYCDKREKIERGRTDTKNKK
jgi:hypothetical protein